MMYQQMRTFLSGRQVINDDQYTNILDSVSILNICFFFLIFRLYFTYLVFVILIAPVVTHLSFYWNKLSEFPKLRYCVP